MIRTLQTILALLATACCAAALATPVDGRDPAAIKRELGQPPAGDSIFTAPLMQFAPFDAHQGLDVPGFEDPLGIGVDPQLKVFGGTVQNMDLLGERPRPGMLDTGDIELPFGVVRQRELLASYLYPFIGGKRRALDEEALDLRAPENIDEDALPITAEASPLSLAGFGAVSEFHRPMLLLWTRCPAQAKRIRVMDDLPRNIRHKFQPNPIMCYDP